MSLKLLWMKPRAGILGWNFGVGIAAPSREVPLLSSWINPVASSIPFSRTRAASGMPASIPGSPFIHGGLRKRLFQPLSSGIFWENRSGCSPRSLCCRLSIQPGALGDHFHGKRGIRSWKNPHSHSKSWQRELFANTGEKAGIMWRLCLERDPE